MQFRQRLKRWLQSILLILLTVVVGFVLIQVTPTQADECGQNAPFLGIGLGYNQYLIDQVHQLADFDPCILPLLYNWGPGNSSQTPENQPHFDFPHRFVPMNYGCSTGKLVSQLEARKYQGPVLVFNEPDREDQANCSPEKAARVLHELHRFRLDYQQGGSNVEFIVGGVGDSTHGLAWMEHFIVAYQEQFGTNPFESGVARGVHFHLYPEYAYENGLQAFGNIQAQMNVWNAWLEKRDLSAWVTELGVLNTPDQPMAPHEYALFLRESIRFLARQERVEHAFVFTLNAASGTASARFARTALVVDGFEMPAYEVVKAACIQDKLCLPTTRTLRPSNQSFHARLAASPLLSPAVVARRPAPQTSPTYSRPNRHSYALGYGYEH